MKTPPAADPAALPTLAPAGTEPIASESVTPTPAVGGGRAGGRALRADKFPIVAMGGSAGSIEAFRQFFAHLPPRSGLAYVVVMHLAPTHDGQVADVLQRFTAMPVVEVTDGVRVRPNYVYVIPPGRDLSLLHGALFLLNPTEEPARRLPIDFFLQSLAKDAGDRAVCIIFSGLGSDGSLGLKLVMESFGMVMVQEPSTAAYDSMPRAALATEFVDFVLPPAQMPAQLLDYAERPLVIRAARSEAEESADKPGHALQKIFLLIRQQTGHDFSYYKRNTVFRRIERRMNAHQIQEFTSYVRYLQENPPEVDQLFRELLIGVTKFFRDAEAFEQLQVHLRPLLLAKSPESTIRVWAPGCSTGEEAYSLAMTLFECLDAIDPNRRPRVQIFATDISADGVATARAGVYSENIAADVSAGRLHRFFLKKDGHYHIRKEVRDVVVFALHNINKDSPFTKLDLLCCRNLLIYLSGELQKNLLPIFHYALNPGGLLFLGPSENLTGFQDLFQPLDVKWKISRRTEVAVSMPRLVNFPFSLTHHPAVPLPPTAHMPLTPSAHRQGGPFAGFVQKALLQAYAPPAVVITAKGEILYVNGRTGKYLEPAPGLSGMNLFEMAREELSFELSGAVHRAVETGEDVVVDNVHLKTEAGHQLLRLVVRRLLEPEALASLLLVSFEDQPTPRRVRQAKMPRPTEQSHDAAVDALTKELQYTKHRLQTTIEEMESSLEELKSTNEELQSANEELQSTNEEAMTNKEEMQSLNEELMTLNLQYLSKTEELGQTANDMKNLLDATDIAIIFLDNDMVVKRFTPRVGRIINLLPADVGRPLTHFASNLRYEHLVRDVQQVLDRLTSFEINIQTARNEWYTMRILPYRSFENYINGAVITFTEITALKLLETRLQETARFTESLHDAVREPLLALSSDLTVYRANQAFAGAFGGPAAELAGQPLASLHGGAWNQPALLHLLQQLLEATSGNQEFDDLPLEADFGGLGRRYLLLSGRQLQYQGAPTGQVLLRVRELPAPQPD
ncbi:chemotaxis protein CheR [Hymenobacter sp. HMF4947]|uniref:protein-glutamate O-methyltransferase n=1 Tax=Hymenobacter ginkgonis TaxID=2682976 RepID=A0A7K1T8R7_9BACT|nr:CheR family methyltransferase [Hymenobacter ginkgonis]MVN74794.1 chemotaxis protein CheR [Hymenobacter ginkgonis]